MARIILIDTSNNNEQFVVETNTLDYNSAVAPNGETFHRDDENSYLWWDDQTGLRLRQRG